MSDRLQVYETDQIRVTFDPKVCIHSGTCLRALPAVFDVSRPRWVRPEAASPDAVLAAVAKCPSGALQASFITAVHQVPAPPEPQPAAAAVKITVRPGGSLLLEGPFQVVMPDGTLVREGVKCGLCRCGHSKTKPFCDGSHKAYPGFDAEPPAA